MTGASCEGDDPVEKSIRYLSKSGRETDVPPTMDGAEVSSATTLVEDGQARASSVHLSQLSCCEDAMH